MTRWSLLPLGLLALLTAGCAHPMSGGGPFLPPPPRAYGAPAPPSPVGRWDNVMMLEIGVPLRVLRMDGGRADGRFHSASPAALRVEAGGSVIEIPHGEVARVDRLSHFGGDAQREAARGAAVGMGAVGVIGLITGRMPPARHWAAGAIIGGYGAGQSAVHAAGPGTIYLAGCEAVRQGAAGCGGGL